MFRKDSTFLAMFLVVCISSLMNTAASSCTSESLPNFLDLDKCLVIPQDLCTNPDMLMPFTQSLISCGMAAIADLETPSKLFLMQGIAVNVLQSVGLGKFASAMFGFCKTVGGIKDTLAGFSLGNAGAIVDPLKPPFSLLPLPDCSKSSIKGTVKCGKRISVKLPSSLKASECFKHVWTTCNFFTADKGPALVALFETISCLTGKVFDVTTPEGVAGLTCSALTGLAQSAGSNGFQSLLPIPLGGHWTKDRASSSSDNKDEPDDSTSNVISTALNPVLGDMLTTGTQILANVLPPLGTQKDDTKAQGALPSLFEAVTNPLSLLNTGDKEQPKGLLPTVLDAITPSSQAPDDGKPNGIISGIADALTRPGWATSSDSSGDSEPPAQDKEKPKGLFSGMLDAFAGPLLGNDLQTKSDTDSESHTEQASTSDNTQQHGLFPDLLGLMGR